jgi:hypothetical protein
MHVSVETISVAAAFTLLATFFCFFTFFVNLVMLVVPTSMVRVCANDGYELYDRADMNKTPTGYVIMPTVMVVITLVMQLLPVVMFGIATYALRRGIPWCAIWRGAADDDDSSHDEWSSSMSTESDISLE